MREIERLLGIVVIAKDFRPRMLINIKNVKKRYIENIFTNWKLFQNVLKNRELIYLRFGNVLKNWKEEAPYISFSVYNAIKIVKLIKSISVQMQSKSQYRLIYRVILLVMRNLHQLLPIFVLKMQSKSLNY